MFGLIRRGAGVQVVPPACTVVRRDIVLALKSSMGWCAGKRSREGAASECCQCPADWGKSAMFLPGPKAVPIVVKGAYLLFKAP